MSTRCTVIPIPRTIFSLFGYIFLGCFLFADLFLCLAFWPNAQDSFASRNSQTVIVSSGFGTPIVCAPLKLFNYGSRAIAVDGVDVPCGCVIVTGLPLTIPPNSFKTLELTLNLTAINKPMHLSFFCSPCKGDTLRVILHPERQVAANDR